MKKVKGLITWICILVIYIKLPTFAFDDIPIVEIIPPNLKLSSTSNLTIGSGETEDFEILIKNIGGSAASGVLIQTSIGTGDIPFSVKLTGKTSNRYVYIQPNAEYKMNLNIAVDKDAKSMVLPITLNYSFKDTQGKNLTGTDTIAIKIEGTRLETPNVLFSGFRVNKEHLMAGEGFEASGILENVGGSSAKDVQILLEGLSAETIYLFGSSNNWYYKEIISEGYTNPTFTLASSSEIKTGSYPINFKVRYRDGENQLTEATYTYYVNVQAIEEDEEEEEEEPGKAYLEIRNMREPTGIVGIGEEFTISFDVVNTSSYTAKNIKITAVTDAERAIVPKSTGTQFITFLDTKQSKSLTFKFAPTNEAKTQNYTIGFQIDFEARTLEDKEPEKETTLQYAGINVFKPEEEEKEEEDEKEEESKVSKPKIIIDSYEVTPMIVKAGGEFDLSMVFRNTHSTKSIENIKAVISPNETVENKGNVFMPVNGSNTFFINKITPNSTSAKQFKMYAIPDAEPRTYTMTVRFKYQDAEYNDYEEEEIIGIAIKQSTKLETGNISIPSEGFIGSPINIMCNLMNTGKATLNNLSAEVTGNFDVSKSFMYFGSLNKSASAYYDTEIIPTEAGTQKGVILLKYEDESGEATVIEREFTINVTEDMPMPEFEEGINPEMMEGNYGDTSFKDRVLEYIKKPVVWLIIVALVIGVVFGKKYHDKQRRKFLDE